MKIDTLIRITKLLEEETQNAEYAWSRARAAYNEEANKEIYNTARLDSLKQRKNDANDEFLEAKTALEDFLEHDFR